MICCVFASFSKQYIKNINGSPSFVEKSVKTSYDAVLKEIQELLDNGYHIDNIIPTNYYGYTINYIIIYSDDK